MNKQSVVIIGGGISGLIAARGLSAAYHVTLLEAQPQFGGRILTLNAEGFAAPIEGGAEFVHGDAGETFRILKEAGISTTKVEGELYRLQPNGLLEKEEGQVEGWDLLMDRMKGITDDLTLQQLLNLHFGGEQFDLLRKQAITFAEGFDLADIHTVSVKSLYEEWSNQGEDHRVDGGYGLLIDYLVKDCLRRGCMLLTDTVVKEINWQRGEVQVSTREAIVYPAELCLVTVPLGVLRSAAGPLSLNFSPPITDYLAALDDIGFGTVIKVILSFEERFWPEDAAFFFSDEQIPTWWGQFPADVPILTGWVGGPEGRALSVLSEAELLETALGSLAILFDKSATELKDKLKTHQIFNWQQRPPAAGAYSFATTASTPARLIELNMPVEDTIYFAGEALYTGLHPGTVEAAVVNSLAVVKRISRLIRQHCYGTITAQLYV